MAAPSKVKSIHSPASSSSLIPGAVPQTLPREQIIDEFGELDRKLKSLEPTRKRHEALKSIIKSWYEQFPSEQAAEEQGKQYLLIVSPREMEASPKLPEIFKLCGRSFKRFCKLVSVTQSAVKKAFGEESIEQCFLRERTGARKLTVVAKASPAA
jgi:hypothetical protein